MHIKRGDIYWIKLVDETTGEHRITHPHVILEHSSDIVTACSITTNMKKISVMGNILLNEHEGKLPKQSIIEVTKIVTVPISQLGEYIGTLGTDRVAQILARINFVNRSFFDR